VRFRLVPRDDGFFALFSSAADNAAATAHLVLEALQRLPDIEPIAEKTIGLEQQGDQLTRRILAALDTAIVTPFDREDIHALAEGFDTAVDRMSAAVDLLRLHKVTAPIEGAADFGQLLVGAAEAAVAATSQLDRLRGLQPHLDEIDRLETQGDQLFRRLTARLFSGEFDAFTVLKWNDVIGSLEAGLDAFEHTADVMTSIVLKHT
jgi:hypothetical protein